MTHDLHIVSEDLVHEMKVKDDNLIITVARISMNYREYKIIIKENENGLSIERKYPLLWIVDR